MFYAPSVYSSLSTITNKASATLANLTAMVSNIHDKNAEGENMQWITTAPFAGLMRSTAEFPSNTLVATGGTLWQGRLDRGTMLGYGASSTTQVSKVMTSGSSLDTGGASHGIVFGNWADMFIAMFGAMELVVDPYSLKKRGVIEVTTFQMADILIRHGESFAKGNCTLT